jgi:hypothetical protein
MTSPVITVGETGDVGPRLTFDHNVQTELGFDGGTVKVAVNGGTFETVPATAYVFNEPTVLADEDAGNTNPLAGEDGFTGTDGGKIVSDWGTSIIDLEELGVASGDDIQVQFAIGRDGCGGVVGWYVDNVAVTTCVEAPIATPVVEATHAPEPVAYGSNHAVNVTVSGSDAAAGGTVTVKEGATTLGSASVTAGAATVALPKTMSVGAHNLTVDYSGDANYAAGSDTVTATITKAATSITAKAKPKTVTKGKKFTTIVKVTSAGSTPTGLVIIKYKGTKIGEGTLVNGMLTLKLKADFPVGDVTLKAKYRGSASHSPSKTTYDLAVAKK